MVCCRRQITVKCHVRIAQYQTDCVINYESRWNRLTIDVTGVRPILHKQFTPPKGPVFF